MTTVAPQHRHRGEPSHRGFELAWAPHLFSTMDYTYRERHGETIYRFKNGMLPSDFFRRNIVLSFQEDAIAFACATSAASTT